MGQLFSSEEELSLLKEALGSVMYEAMLEGGAVPDLGVVHPLILANQNEDSASQPRLQAHLQQLQRDMGNRAPTYLRDLIGRLSAFSDEPRLAGLVGLVVTMVMDMAYSSSKRPSGEKGRSAGSSSCQQRIWELEEVMEEYLKRCRINLSDKSRLIQDSFRLENQFSLLLTQLKACLLGGDCDSRSLRHWACGAAFHTQMLAHLSRLEEKAEPFSARAALDQYKQDLKQIIPAYRNYRSNTVVVVKCRGVLLANLDPCREVPEDGTMTGLTVMDRETGKSVSIPLSTMEADIRRRCNDSDHNALNLDLITSDQYAQAYLDHLFSSKGPLAELENYFTQIDERLGMQRYDKQSKSKNAIREMTEQRGEVHLSDMVEGNTEQQKIGAKEIGEWTTEHTDGAASLKLSIVETQPEESLSQAD
ncbi:uncharacterized protein [Nothobranchius furzeri]|uniref:Transcript variant X1 n=6 Tax=Nothobranchius TaxID=28779 RepID=A0A9D3BUV8_NOTFU|nr:transcript variant X1 [Nothobranchius furzeri]